MSGKFLRKFFNKTLGRPGTRFAKRADSPAGNIIADCLQCARIFRDAAAIEHAFGNFFHPKRAFAAGRALAARLMCIKFVDVVEHPNHVARIVEHDHAAGSSH